MKHFQTRTRAVFFALCFMAVATAGLAADRIRYEVRPKGETKQYQINIIVPHADSKAVRFQIPTWSPGAYMIGNYAANITDVSAYAVVGKSEEMKKLEVTQPDKLTWEVATNGAKTIHFSYTTNNSDVQMADGKMKRAHISGPRTYMYVVGRKTDPVLLSLSTPIDWKIATSLDPATDPDRVEPQSEVRHAYSAPNYDVLADAPVEMGDYAEENFEVRGVPHKIVLYGNYAELDRKKLLEQCKQIAETEIAFFNDIPFKRYVFMYRASGGRRGGAGGLEHLGSTEISLLGMVDDRVRSVSAHEYFHLWNVKRIRPFVLGPFDYTGPDRTSNLWWSEGVTSYYGDLLSRRGGLNTDDEYLKHLGDTITQLQNNPARLKVTADESSYKVWDGGGSQGFGRMSYYTKGELIGLCMDMKIRKVTGNKKSLDDVMKSLYKQCGKGNGPGFGEDDIKKTTNQVAGQDLSAFYDQLARSTDEMPFKECLGYAGLGLLVSDSNQATPNLGMTLFPDQDQKSLRVRSVDVGGPAAQAGIQANDLVVGVNGTTLTPAFDFSSLRTAAAGTHYNFTIDRGGVKQEVSYTVGASSRKPWTVLKSDQATPEQLKIRESWLTGK